MVACCPIAHGLLPLVFASCVRLPKGKKCVIIKVRRNKTEVLVDHDVSLGRFFKTKSSSARKDQSRIIGPDDTVVTLCYQKRSLVWEILG